MKFGIKEYAYTGGNTFYYVTINGRQVGLVHFSKKEVLATIEKIKKGERW
jgi:hypothetical protein